MNDPDCQTTPANQPPVLGTIGNKSGAPGSAITFTATATDPNAGQTLTFSLTGAPAGATINSSTGAFSWTPASAGTFTVTVVVADNGTPSLSDSEAITITVTAGSVSGPLTVTPAGDLTSSGIAGGPFTPSSQIYTLTNTGTAPMDWTASIVQSWVTLSATGGTLTAGANTTVTASINAGANSLAAGSYSDNITFTNTSNGTGNTTRPVDLTVNASGPPPPITLSSDSGGGSCSVVVRPGSGGSAIDGTLILAGLGMAVWGIRIQRRRG